MIAPMCFCLRLFTLPSSRKSGLRQRTRFLRNQPSVLQREIRFTNGDRLFFIWLFAGFHLLDALRIVRPETLIRWHLPVFIVTGVGSPGREVAGRKLMRICAP